MADRHGALRRCIAAGLLLAIAIATGGAAAPPAAGAPRLVWRIDEPARGIPARDDESVYFLTQHHELAAVGLRDARIRWRVPVDPTAPTFGSRVIVRGDVVVAGDYDLMGVDRATGRVRWVYRPEDGGGAGLYLGASHGALVFSGSLTGALRAIDARTGHVSWQHQLGPPDRTTVFEPVVTGPWLVATYTIFGERATGGLALVDLDSGRLLWQRGVPGSTGASGSPAVTDDSVFAAARDGTIHAFDLVSGEARWTLPPVEDLGGEPDYRPLAARGNLLVAGSLSGEVVAHDVETRRVRWRRPATLYSVGLRLMVTGDVVYVPFGSAEIVALALRDGRELWRIGGRRDEMRWLPLAHDPWLAAAGSRTLALFRLDEPPVRNTIRRAIR